MTNLICAQCGAPLKRGEYVRRLTIIRGKYEYHPFHRSTAKCQLIEWEKHRPKQLSFPEEE